MKINLINGLLENFKIKKEVLAATFMTVQHGKTNTSDFFNKYPQLIDKTIQEIAGLASQSIAVALPCIVATGGYGRKELAPFSDIDLLLVSAHPLAAPAREWVETMAAAFWGAGIRLSYSVRTLDDCATAMDDDFHFLTSLLEKRLIWGDRKTFMQFEKVFQNHISDIPPGQFVAAKLAERDNRHLKMGDTRLHLQPNIKESKGGLRDIQTLLWIANFLYALHTPEGLVRKKVLTKEEAASLREAWRFFWTVRCHLHLLAGRADDRLTFDAQPEIARRMGYDDAEPNLRAEKFMQHYFRMANETGYLTRIICADLEARSLSGGATSGARRISFEGYVEKFPCRHNRLTVTQNAHFRYTPADIVRIFRAAQISGMDIHPDALRLIRAALEDDGAGLRKNRDALGIFMEIMTDHRHTLQTLRRMNESGVLTALIPAFANIHAHMQYDMYHVFTADEHTLNAVDTLHRIEQGELHETAALATELFEKIHSRRALYAAMFFHDIAKGTGGQHAQKGAKIMQKSGPLLGLDAAETETAAWLVENHLLLTMTALKRDINDPRTVADFAAAVQSPERLRLLTIMTAADIMAVGPDRWNGWKAGLIAELHHRATALLSGEDSGDDLAVATAQEAVNGLLKTTAEKSAAQMLREQTPPHFWRSFSPERMAVFIGSMAGHTDEEIVIRITPLPQLGHTEVFVYTPDRRGLFATLSGAMAAAGASIADARIFTLTDGMALDVFQVHSLRGDAYENDSFLQKTIRKALAGKLDIAAEIADRNKNRRRHETLFAVPPRVIVDNSASNSHTLIEVNGRDRPGFLHDITAALTAAGLQISAAKVTTFGAKAMDVFYVKDAYGLKITHPERIAGVEKTLLAALAD